MCRYIDDKQARDSIVWWAILAVKADDRQCTHGPDCRHCLSSKALIASYARCHFSHEFLSHSPYRNHPKRPGSLAHRREAVITH